MKHILYALTGVHDPEKDDILTERIEVSTPEKSSSLTYSSRANRQVREIRWRILQDDDATRPQYCAKSSRQSFEVG